MLQGQQAEVYLTSAGKNDQKPLDLNPPSPILLFTFFKIRMKITVQLLLGIINEHEAPKKIVIYEKQNLHALVELTTTGGARQVKEALDGKLWKNMFLIRVQYTSKKNLSVNPNSPFEYEQPEGDQDENDDGHDDHGIEQQYYVGNYMPYNPMAPPMRRMPPTPPMYNGYHPYPSPQQKMGYNMPPSPGMKATTHVIQPMLKPSPQQQTRPIVQLQPPPGLRSGQQIRYSPVQMQHINREKEVDPKEVYYYNKNNHQYAPPTYPDLFNSPQIIAPFQQQNVKYSHDKPDERYLLQYCSPMVRPRPLNPPQPHQISRYRVVKVSGLKDNFRYESLLNLCSQFGTVVSLKVIKRDKKSECFIQFYQHTEASIAAEHLDSLTIDNSKIDTSLTKYLNLQEIDIFEKGKTVSLPLLVTFHGFQC
jgi:RNA recognition motif. (a.k.a. RRM, RBD, or RNP domain)